MTTRERGVRGGRVSASGRAADGNGHALRILAHLLYHRDAYELPTVVTLDLTCEAFRGRYATRDGGRPRDLLAGSAGPSLRMRLALEDVAS